MRLRIDDLPAQQIRSLLSADRKHLAEEEAAALRDFIERIGGQSNAQAAAEMLERLEGRGHERLS